jgi:UMF1 family MFS transporter
MSQQNGVASLKEIRGWYLYDWANSPFFQVVDVLCTMLLKRMAEFAEIDGTWPDNFVSPGGYPAVVLWCTSAAQIVFLLSFSAFGDYGGRRKQLLIQLTYLGSAFLIVIVFCADTRLWWLLGMLRVAAGLCFVMSNVYYNAFLPLLAAAHPELTELAGEAHLQREVAVQDEMSNKGFLTGYLGGMVAQLLCFFLFLAVECDVSDPACIADEFSRLFWLALCIAAVGIWWGGFSVYTFANLQARPGPEFPEGANVLCLGWAQSYDTLKYVAKFRNTLLFVIAYFFWSDALSTMQKVAQLVLADAGSTGSQQHRSDSSIIFFMALGTIGGVLGSFALMKIQQGRGLSNKTMLMWQLCIYGVVSAAGGAGVVTAFNGRGFFIVLTPVCLMMGSLLANQRSLYSSLCPVGREAAMFALYAITDKGSTLVGAGVIAAVHTATGSYTPVFWYCSLAFCGSAALLFFVDVEEGRVAAGKNPEAVATSEAEAQ